jgi:hypothetical protein
MVPSSFFAFFAASAGAGAALMGLLFVAVSIAPERTVGSTASLVRQASSFTVFTAMANAFFVSLSALVPKANVGYAALALSLIGIVSTLSLSVRLSLRGLTWTNALPRFTLVAASFTAYGFELYDSIRLLVDASDVSAVDAITTLMLAIYGIGLVRAWELIGAHRQGFLLAWLSPLREEEKEREEAPSARP